jgi:hypothetical protein
MTPLAEPPYEHVGRRGFAHELDDRSGTSPLSDGITAKVPGQDGKSRTRWALWPRGLRLSVSAAIQLRRSFRTTPRLGLTSELVAPPSVECDDSQSGLGSDAGM